MNSLREEISCHIRKTDCWELADRLSDDIISIIEKRIDEMINNLEQKMKMPFKERPILTLHDLNLLRFVKEEMLK